MAAPSTDHIYRYEFTVPPQAMDENGHVNNVHFVQWMQDVAVRHYESIGGIPPTQALGATWVVRSHLVEYLSPAFAGDLLEVRTWIANIRRVRSLRRYEFIRKSDGRLLVRGETDWVFVDVASGRPRAIPPEVAATFPLCRPAAGKPDSSPIPRFYNLLPLGADADKPNRYVGQPADGAQVGPRRCGQVHLLVGPAQVLVPAGELLVDRLVLL